MANFRGKRMVDEDLIKKLEELEPGGGYTAGAGISINDGVLSVDYGSGITVSDGTLVVDTSVIALKSEIVTSYNDLTDKPDLSGYQTTSNLVTSLSSASTDTQYPSAKCVYNIVGDIESLLAAI